MEKIIKKNSWEYDFADNGKKAVEKNLEKNLAIS